MGRTILACFYIIAAHHHTHAHGNGTVPCCGGQPAEWFSNGQRRQSRVCSNPSPSLSKPAESGLHVLDFDAAMAKRPSQVVFNGHTSALTAAPLVANAGEHVRIYFHNVGPSDGSRFHVVGAIFDRGSMRETRQRVDSLADSPIRHQQRQRS